MAMLVEVGTEVIYRLQERTSIGRDPRCDIRLDDPMVSSHHAEVVRGVTGAYRLRDLGSRRGTFVGASQVDEIELHDGDELLIGPTRMRFHTRPIAAAAPPAAAGAIDEIRAAADDEWRHRERVLRDLPAGVIVLDRRGRCRIANRWITSRIALFGPIEPGTAVAAIAGVPCERLCSADQRIQTSVHGRALEIVTQRSIDDGETVIVISDHTDELERLTQAAHHDRLALVGQLASGIAHDFNNLLSIMLTYASMLEESITDPGTRADIQTITRAASSASQLTRQLLMFSRREIVTPTVIDPASRVRSLDSMLRRLLGDHIELDTEIAGRVPHLLIDGAQFEQIVVNLVINARDAVIGQGRGRVRLRLSQCQLDDRSVGQLPAGCYALLEVEDTGSGMSPDAQAHIFEPYFTTKGQLQGSGLGLATVHAIVGQAHGDIVVTSELGCGTTFRIFLPETGRPLEAAAGSEPAPRDGSTVLVVDDDDDVRRMVERALRRASYIVMTATSGPDAIARARAYPGEIDLLVTDVVMPGMTGQELIRELSAERPGLQVVFMSGYHQGAPVDPRQFVAKPFDRATLLSTVADVLANRPGNGLE
jgi:signal transduction histidine kinase